MYISGVNIYISGANMYILGVNMCISGAKMFILGVNMYISGTLRYQHPLGKKVYLLKMYNPSDSFCTFFFLRVHML